MDAVPAEALYPPPGSFKYEIPVVKNQKNLLYSLVILFIRCLSRRWMKYMFFSLFLFIVGIVLFELRALYLLSSKANSLFTVYHLMKGWNSEGRKGSYTNSTANQKAELCKKNDLVNKSSSSLITGPSKKYLIVKGKKILISKGENPGNSERNTTPLERVKKCPPVPIDLDGRLKVDTTPVSLETVEKMHPEVTIGGSFGPKHCFARHKVAIIIPFRNRETHLSIFLNHMHSFLQKQLVNYTIFVVEQEGNESFNRAMLFNVGFIEAMKLSKYQCMIFHDVDLLPEDDRNLYTCPIQPRHLSVSVDQLKYKLPYSDIFGGVAAMNVEQFKKVNGFSNKFWGWGGEDDDMSNRLKIAGYFISRYPSNIARYKMLTHGKTRPNPKRYLQLKDGIGRSKTSGLKDIKYRLLKIELKRLYTFIYVRLLR